MRIVSILLTLAAFGGAACAKKESAADQVRDTTPEASSQMTMQGMAMIPVMQAHLDSMATMPPDQLKQGMAGHEDLASRTMDAMGADMRGMSMTPDSAWTALSDSLRRDLAELPALAGIQLQNRMQAHIGRMRRMMVLHADMMKM